MARSSQKRLDVDSKSIENVAIVGHDLSEFDADFYADRYADLKHLETQDLPKHWLRYGRAEGRFPNMRAWVRAEAGLELPVNFSIKVYRNSNPDLSAFVSDLDLVGHYISSGKNENRIYSIELDSIRQDLYGQDDDVSVQDEKLKKLLSGESLSKFFEKNGIYSTAFLKLFDLNDYQARVGISNCRDRLEGIIHFVRLGQYELMPIGSDYDLDEAFYSEFAPSTMGLTTLDTYRHWLNRGIEDGLPVNPANLMKNLGVPATRLMPVGFDWQSYVWANPDLPDDVKSPWQALKHFATHGILENRQGVTATPSTAPFFVKIADRLAMQGDLQAARRIYETGLLGDPLNTVGLRHYADCLMRIGELFSAITVYQKTIKENRYNAWTFLNLSDCLAKMGRRLESVQTLRQLSRIMPSDQYIKSRALQASEDYYYNVSSTANGLATAGFYQRGFTAMEAAVNVLTDTVSTASPSLPGEGSLKQIAIVADMSIPQCKYYRVLQKQEHLTLAGYEVEVFDQATDLSHFHRRLPFLDVAIFYRVAALPPAVRAISAARKAGIPTLYDIDDLIFDSRHFPDSFKSYGGLISAEVYAGLVTGNALFKAAMSLCDFAMSSTSSLAMTMKDIPLQKHVFLYPNALGAAEEYFLNRDLATSTGKRSGRPVHIFYGTGTRAHNEDFELLAGPALIKLFKKHGSNIRLVIVGYLSLPEEFDEFRSYIYKVDKILDRNTYFNLLSDMDISLAVLNAGIIADCKSEIKWMESAVAAVPSVVSRTATYDEVVEHNHTALIAENSEDWYAHLDRLILNPALRVKIGKAAQDVVSTRYSTKNAAANAREILTEVERRFAARPNRPKLKVMIVHVFFPPQAIGGATRVVADNALDIKTDFGDDVEIEVFTTIEGGTHPYDIQVYRWNNIRVTGVTTPIDPDIDLKVSDPNMGKIFGQHLDRFQPDLVHFHCIQRLTPSVCNEALHRKIPYFVTIHDGWWISQNQFLLDQNNMVSSYYSEKKFQQFTSKSMEQFHRMKELQFVLSKAESILSVSEAFARIYRDAGVKNVKVVENGVSDLPIRARTVKSEKVCIAHIGGKSFHKGFNHLRAALSDLACSNLEVLLIDHAFSSGEETVTVWGESAVKIRGKFPQSQVADLYATINVLMAPSVWPESYGLVVREALRAGCWVVVSDRGALQDSVSKDCGFVVPVDDYEALKDVLQEINDNVLKFQSPPSYMQKLRSSKDQARDLMQVYKGATRAI